MSRDQKKRRRRTNDEIRRIVAELKKSGLKREQFARSQGISPSCLDNWRCGARGGNGKSKKVRRMVRVRLKSSPSTSESLEVRVNDRWAVRVPPEFDEETLRRLLQVLVSEC